MHIHKKNLIELCCLSALARYHVVVDELPIPFWPIVVVRGRLEEATVRVQATSVALFSVVLDLFILVGHGGEGEGGGSFSTV
jgi:hypothetical protein